MANRHLTMVSKGWHGVSMFASHILFPILSASTGSLFPFLLQIQKVQAQLMCFSHSLEYATPHLHVINPFSSLIISFKFPEQIRLFRQSPCHETIFNFLIALPLFNISSFVHLFYFLYWMGIPAASKFYLCKEIVCLVHHYISGPNRKPGM